MVQGQSSSRDTKAEKEAYKRQVQERELKEREERLEGHRKYLQEQMVIRRDYYKLGLFHKIIIVSLFLLLLTFVCFLVLSYFPPTKTILFRTMHQVF